MPVKMTAEVQDEWLGVVKLTGELDAYSGAEFREVIETLMAGATAFLLVDLMALEYIDSVGLGILMGGAKRARQQGGEIAVVCERANLRRVFDISGTAELLNVRDSYDEALAVLAAKRQGGTSDAPGEAE